MRVQKTWVQFLPLYHHLENEDITFLRGFLGGFNEMTCVKYWVGQNSFGFFHKVVWENSNELLGQPNTLPELPRWLSGKESTCQYRRHKRCKFDPCVGKIPWKRKWHPTPGFLPGESHRQRRLAVYSPWGCKESDTTELLSYLYLAKYLSQNLSSKGGHYDCNISISILLINHYYELFVVIIIRFPRIMVMAMSMQKANCQPLLCWEGPLGQWSGNARNTYATETHARNRVLTWMGHGACCRGFSLIIPGGSWPPSEWCLSLGGQIPFLLSKPSCVTFWVLQCYAPAPTSWSFWPPLDVWVSSPRGRERCWGQVHGRSWLLGVGAVWSGAEVTELLETTPGLEMEWSGMFSCFWVILTSSQDRSHMCFSCTCQQKLDTRHTPAPTTGSRQRSISACSSPLPYMVLNLSFSSSSSSFLFSFSSSFFFYSFSSFFFSSSSVPLSLSPRYGI